MAKRKRPGNALASTLKRIRLFATDVDGVLTDAGMYYSESGEELKKFNTRDGMGIKLLQRAGIVTAIVTQERTKLVARRGEKLMATRCNCRTGGWLKFSPPPKRWSRSPPTVRRR